MPAMIQLQNISIQRGGRHLLEEANLTLHPGWRVGITGRNGTGKSTLFALLNDQLEADGGSCSLPKHWRIATMAQEVSASDRSALDYVLDGDTEFRRVEQALKTTPDTEAGELHEIFASIDGYSAPARASTLLHGLSFKPGDELRPVSSFSGGWRIRLNLARALMCPSDLLLLDEPTNHLDLDATLWLEQWLRQYSGTLLLISHDRDFLDQVIEHIVHFDQQQLSLYNGNYSTYEQRRAERLAQQQIAYEKQQARRSEIEAFVNRFRAKATKAKQAQSRLKELARMEDIAPAHSDSGFEFSLPCADKVSSLLLSLDEVNLGYDSGSPTLAGLSLSILPEQRVGLLGHNGAGKSTLIKALADKLPPLSGTITRGEHLRIGYFAQHQLEELDPNASPALHLQRLTPGASEQELRNFLGGYGFQGDRAFETCGQFSGGEKARLALAVIAWQKPNLLLLDEPTNHLDLEMRCALTLALQAFPGAVILISHDRHLLRATVDEFWLVANGCVSPFDGDLDSYRQWLNKENAGEATKEDSGSGEISNNRKLQRQLAAQQREALKPLRQKLKKAESAMEKLQEELETLEAEMSQEGYFEQDKQIVEIALKRQGELRSQLEDTEETWLELSEQLEASNSSL